ncbi:hypothetical protein STEG23_011886, partial [Scotinomys teguina]
MDKESHKSARFSSILMEEISDRSPVKFQFLQSTDSEVAIYVLSCKYQRKFLYPSPDGVQKMVVQPRRVRLGQQGRHDSELFQLQFIQDLEQSSDPGEAPPSP